MPWIFHLFEEKGIDPIDAGYITITSPPMRATMYSLKSLVKWDQQGIYTIAVQNSSFDIHFLKTPPIIHQYKVLSRGNNNCSPSGHTLEGSNDGLQYETMHIYPFDLCGATSCSTKTLKTFELNNTYQFKHVRMVQYKGECDSGFQYFGLTSIDFYGSFYHPTIQSILIKTKVCFVSFFIFRYQ